MLISQSNIITQKLIGTVCKNNGYYKNAYKSENESYIKSIVGRKENT